MKILLLSRGVPNKHDPQEGNFELDQAKALVSQGHQVTILAVDSRVRKYWRKIGVEKKNIDGIKAYKLFLFPTSIVRRLISYKLGLKLEALQAKWLYKYISKKEGNFDLIHAHYLTPIYYASHIKERDNLPIFGTEHWSRVNTDNPAADVRYMAKQGYPALTRLITVSKSLQKRVKDNFHIPSTVIHNLIDTTYLQPLQSIRVKNPFKIVLVGSLIPLKGFDFFLNALSKSSIITKNIEVNIIGGGSEFANLKNQITTLRLENKVHLLGQKPKSVIFEYLNKAHLFVLPSRTENFSVSVLEALSNGLPVIATICGGIRECIDESNGLLVEVDCEEQMINALETMYEKYDRYDFKSIQKECLEQYSPKSIGQQITRLYEEYLEPNKDSI